MLGISISSIEISIYLIIIAGSLLYFGKLIGDVKVERYDKISYYIEGLIFSSIFVFIPLILALYLFSHNIVFNSYIAIPIQFVVLCFISRNIKVQKVLRRYGLLEEFKKRLRIMLEKFKDKNSIKAWAIKKEDWFKNIDYIELNVKRLYEFLTKIFENKFLLFFISFTTIWITISTINRSILVMAISSLFTFFILSMIAISYSFATAYYPYAKIYLKNDKVIDGKLLKFGNFIYLIKDDKKIFINSSEIVFIEENLFKNELKTKEDKKVT